MLTERTRKFERDLAHLDELVRAVFTHKEIATELLAALLKQRQAMVSHYCQGGE